MKRSPGELADLGVPEERRRRGRPSTIDPAHILKVAREVFLARGIRATTSEVAERAGVSEGSIFYRFKSKEALFREAMQLSEEDVPRLLLSAVDSLDDADDDAGLEESLIRLAQSLVDIARVGLPLMMMSWSNPAQNSCTKDDNIQRFRLFIQRLAEFFERHMDSGRLRRVDAEVLARTFLGSIHHYCMSRILAADTQMPFIPEGMFIRGHVDLLLRGAQAEDDARPSSYQRHMD